MSNFTTFYEGWLGRQEDFLRRLESLLSPVDGFDREGECGKMIPRVMEHYREFYREKAAAVEEDVFVSISPPWMSSFERSLLWVTGFRPSILFPIMEGAVAEEELAAGQRRRIEEVKAESRRREREITQAMARVQETMAEQPVYGLIKNYGGGDGAAEKMRAAVEELKAAMREVVADADTLQGWTVAEAVEALGSVQGVRFLAAAARFQLRARRWGVERDG